MSDYAPKRGDRVRVVLEGEVRPAAGFKGFLIGFNCIDPSNEHVVSVEKLEPPVTVFGPGDVVRDVSDYLPGQELALADDGYVNLGQGMFHRYGKNRKRERITSERYERVILS